MFIMPVKRNKRGYGGEMKKYLFFMLFGLAFGLQGQTSKVYLGIIEGDIDLGLAPYVKRIVETAEADLADAIVFRINTFGGRVDAATQIKDAIMNSKVMTIAFIDKRAISAGALISISCNKIVMVPGASIGATTVVDQEGKKQSEKYQSYMRSEMRATAEKNGRRTDIAEGMVDETVEVEGLVGKDKLITLTSEEAKKFGFADTVVSDLDSALSAFGIKSYEIIESKENWGESVVRFLSNPVISSLLIMVALVGLFTEIKTPGWGLPGTAAVIALALFFGSGFILELVSWLEILLFFAGVVFLIVEIFFVPGFGIFGILGITMMVGGIFLGLVSDLDKIDGSLISAAIIQLAVTFIISGVLIFVLLRFLPKSSVFHKLILATNIESSSGYISSIDNNEMLIGLRGISYTDLRPAGTAVIDGRRFDVVTDGEFIGHDNPVVVKKVSGSRIVVEEVKD